MHPTHPHIDIHTARASRNDATLGKVLLSRYSTYCNARTIKSSEVMYSKYAESILGALSTLYSTFRPYTQRQSQRSPSRSVRRRTHRRVLVLPALVLVVLPLLVLLPLLVGLPPLLLLALPPQVLLALLLLLAALLAASPQAAAPPPPSVL